MKYRTRIYYTEEQKALMWDRWLAKSQAQVSEIDIAPLQQVRTPLKGNVISVVGLLLTNSPPPPIRREYILTRLELYR